MRIPIDQAQKLLPMRRVMRGRRGVSILLAILIFLLCALAGATAITMASANAGRYAHATKDQQPYYSTISAAMLIRDMVNDVTYNSKTINYTYERSWEYVEEKGVGVHQPTGEYYTLEYAAGDSTWKNDYLGDLKGTTFMNMVKTQCDALVPYLNIPGEWYESTEHFSKTGAINIEKPKTAPESVSYEFTIAPSSSDPAPEAIGTVFVTFVMSDNYDLLFTFESRENNDKDGKSLYAVTLYMEATVDMKTQTGVPTYSYRDKDGAGNYTTGSLRQETTRTISIRWKDDNATISRGGVNNG